ncbi:MAG TPA: four helix bundle protein [Caldithrix sp.]|nr:four helix bundle protein [Caldithrix sp.]
MKNRTKQFALRVINLYRYLPKTTEAQILGKQLLRSVTSVAANYRAVCRARSNREFFSKLSIVVEEMDESAFWMEMLMDANILKEDLVHDLLKEGNEILKIVSKSRKKVNNSIIKKFNN